MRAKMQLDGIRVIDLTRILSGPFCSMFLADMGAEVIKIEEPGEGDPLRRQGAGPEGFSNYFASFNRNKRSVTLSLRSAEGKEVLRRLLRTADVVLDNYRPGVMERMGFGRAALKALKPDLVVAHVTGFGLTGPYAERPAFDFIAQAMSGFMSVNGAEGAPPQRAGPPLSDLIAGAYAAMGILAALVRRARTGEGEEVATSLTDGMASMLAFFATDHFATGKLPVRTGNDHPIVAPYGLFRAADGEIAVAPSTETFYQRLIAALGLERLRADPRFSSNAERMRHRAAINAEVESVTRTAPVAHWIEKLNEAGVPCGRVLDLAEAFADPQIRHQQMRMTVEQPEHGTLEVLGFPIKFTDAPCAMHRPPPSLGADTDDVLASLGYVPSEIARLRAANVI